MSSPFPVANDLSREELDLLKYHVVDALKKLTAAKESYNGLCYRPYNNDICVEITKLTDAMVNNQKTDIGYAFLQSVNTYMNMVNTDNNPDINSVTNAIRKCTFDEVPLFIWLLKLFDRDYFLRSIDAKLACIRPLTL